MQGHERASEYKTITEENNERNTLYIVVSVVTLFLFVLVCIVSLWLKQHIQKVCCITGVRKEYLSTRNFTGNKMFSFVSQSCSDSMLYSSSECSKIAVVKRISKSLQDSSSFWETEAFDNFLNENNTITRYPKSHSSHACEDSSIKKSKINSIEEKTIPSNQQNMISCNDRKTNSTNSCSSNSNAEEYINFSEEGNMNYENDSQTNLNKEGCMEASVKRHVYSSDKEEYVNSGSVRSESNAVMTICYPNVSIHSTGGVTEGSQDNQSDGSLQTYDTYNAQFVNYSTFPKTNPKFKFHVDNNLKNIGYYSQ